VCLKHLGYAYDEKNGKLNAIQKWVGECYS
jgi:hypothetical protein